MLKYSAWMVARGLFAMLAYSLSYLHVGLMVVTDLMIAGADRAEAELALADAEARTRQERERLRR